MTTTTNNGVKLSNYQKKIIMKGNFPINIRLNNKSLIGPDILLLTKRQFNKIQKSLNNGTGTDLKLKKNQILYDNDRIQNFKKEHFLIDGKIQQGGFLGALANLGRIILPFVSKLAPKILKPLASGAVNALGSLGIEKLISGKGLLQDLQQKYNFNRSINKEEIINDIQRVIKFLEENKNFKVNKRQQGGFLGALAAAIGIPLIAKLFGAGSIQEGQGILSNFLKMIGLGMDFDSNRTSQNLIDFFPPHTTSNVKGPSNIKISGGKGLSLNKEYQGLDDFFPSHTSSNVKKKNFC